MSKKRILKLPRIEEPSTWAGNLLVCMALGELGYSRFHMMMSTVAGYGYLMWKGKVLYQMGAYIHATHNDLVKAALEMPGWERLVFLEHDHEFPGDTLFKHSQYKEPIVAGLYVLRDENQPLPVVYKWDKGRANALHYNAAETKEMLENPGLHRVDVVPMGCTSIRRDVLEGWAKDERTKDYPMFNSFTNPRGSTMSDDVWFCRLADDAGWNIYLDTSLQCGHLKQISLTVPTFIGWYNQRGWKDRGIEPGSEGNPNYEQPVAEGVV